MAGPDRRGKSGLPGAGSQPGGAGSELDRRLRDLDSALAQKRPAPEAEAERQPVGGSAGFGNALRLSSEFVAAIIVGAGLGWFFDRLAGTSPIGLIVLLLIGFAAGVLNVMRAAGQVAEFGAVGRAGDGGSPGKDGDGGPKDK
ncbi:MAG: AtpZ/AtpI family protein [Rhizobiaceae bacterium]|nr:AtpZ/AtpI family protein [Rhizobiaceae bacterium]